MCGVVHSLCTVLVIQTAPTEVYTLSLHDALPICCGMDISFRSRCADPVTDPAADRTAADRIAAAHADAMRRSEEHTSELQSLRHLVCRLLLEKKKQIIHTSQHPVDRQLVIVLESV